MECVFCRFFVVGLDFAFDDEVLEFGFEFADFGARGFAGDVHDFFARKRGVPVGFWMESFDFCDLVFDRREVEFADTFFECVGVGINEGEPVFELGAEVADYAPGCGGGEGFDTAESHVIFDEELNVAGGFLGVSPSEAEFVGEVGADVFVVKESGVAFFVDGAGEWFSDVVEQGGEEEGRAIVYTPPLPPP